MAGDATVPAPSPGAVAPQVEVRRSGRRRRTVSAYREDGKVIVLIPDRLSRREEAAWVEEMVARLERSEKRRRPTDATLQQRAEALADRYVDGVRPASVRWVDNQKSRWGSCTPTDRSIRLSSRLQGMPAWVVDYVIVHELAHLIEAGHTSRFWAIVDRYPRAERAKGFLEGVALASGHALQPDADEVDD